MIKLIPYNSGWGAPDRGCAEGPATLKKRGLEKQLAKRGIQAEWAEFRYSDLKFDAGNPPVQAETLPLVADYCSILAREVREALAAGEFPATIGGDHSMAVGTWSAVADARNCHGRLGLIWIDAHMDAHPSVRTSLTCNYHATPAAVLLGSGAEELLALAEKRPVLAPEHLVIIGERSHEEAEQEFLRRLGVRIYAMAEIRKRGMQEVIREALERVTKGTECFGVTIDLDAFDPAHAPGVGSPESGGILTGEAFRALRGLASRSECAALEIAEYNPQRGKNMRTTRMVVDLMAALFG